MPTTAVPAPPAPPARAASQAPDSELTAQLTAVLDGHRPELRRQLREALRADWFAPSAAEETLDLEGRRARTLERLRAFAATGLTRIGFPPEHGGTGHEGAADLSGSVIVYEMLGLGDLSLMVKAGVQWGLFGGAVQVLGTARHHRELLPGILDGTLLGCFAMTESGHGSDVQRLRTTATYDPATEEFVVHTPEPSARKDYIGNAARDGRLAVVFAQLETRGERHGVHALLVPLRDDDGRPLPGVAIGDCGAKGGLAGVDNGRLSFDRMRVPRTALLDRYAAVAPDGTYSSPIDSSNRRFFTMIGALVRGRVSVAGAATSAGKVALTIAVQHALGRRQFPGPDGAETLLLDHPSHRRKLLPALARTYALSFVQDEVAALVGTAADEAGRRRLEYLAAGLKATATAHAVRTVQTCREACGGAGYLAENRLPVLRGDVDVFTTFEGDNTVLLQLVAKGLLTDHRHHLGELDALGTARAVAGQVGGLLAERVGARSLVRRVREAVPGRTRSALLDRQVQAALLADREQHVLEGLARRLSHGRGSERGAAQAAAAAQEHMAAAARAAMDRVAFEAFARGVERAEEPARPVLSRLLDLHALATIEADLAWFLVHDRLDPAAARVLGSLVDDLCAGVRRDARTLVDALGVDDAWSAAVLTAD
ncbi:MAG: acyl-CoA dehydrogenase family protein [Kineosporiaceae bacterium]